MSLTKTETAILANAARRDTSALLPLPSYLFVRGVSIIIALERLIRFGLAAERQALVQEPIWRTGDTALTLALTAKGRTSLGVSAAAVEPDPFEGEAAAMPERVRHAVLMSIMSRPRGADVKLIQHETSLPLQTVRTAINTLRADGYLFDHARDATGATTYQLIGWLPGNGDIRQGQPARA